MKQKDSIINLVLRLINEEYAKNKSGISQKELFINIMAIKKKNGEGPAKEEIVEDTVDLDGKKKRTAREKFETNIQSNVSRSIGVLIAKKLISETEYKTYVPYDRKYQRSSIRASICKIPFNKAELFAMTSNTFLIAVSTDYISECVDLLKQYLGSEAYFDVIIWNGYVVVMLRETDLEALEAKRKDLEAMISESYDYHKRKKVKQLKFVGSKAENGETIEV